MKSSWTRGDIDLPQRWRPFMPLEQPSPLYPASASRLRLRAREAGLGAIAGAAVLVVCLLGEASTPATLAATAIAALATALAAWRGALAAHAAPTAAAASDDPTATAEVYLAALEAIADPLVLVAANEPDDLAGRRIIFANAAARSFLRVPREGALLVAAVRRPEVLEAVDESLFGRQPSAVAFETGGAQDRFWRVWTQPIATDAAGGRRLALMVMRDETDARRNERMRADFLANASHELRTPLASLAGFIETLRGHAKEDAAARERFLAIMASQAARMARLIDDLLSLSRIELNEHIPPSATCDLAFAVAEVAETLAPMAAEKRVRLDVRLPPADQAVIVGDRDQILQVVQNLLANAIKYAPEDSAVAVSVRAGATLDEASAADPMSGRRFAEGAGRLPLLTPDRADDARYGVLKVVDAGPGMRREHLPRLSERFYRVEGQKSGERQGTGLGLAIVKHIINRHRGGLIVESAPDLGAEFCAFFPMPHAPDAPAAAPLVAETKLS